MSTTDPATPVADPVAHVEALCGGVAAGEFASSPEARKPGLLTWADELAGLDDAALLERTESAIHASALMQRFRGNYQHIHFRASACFFECLRRGSAEHPSESCPARSNRYQKAYNGVALDQGYGSMTEPLGSCTCPPTTTTEGPTSA